MIEEQKGDKQSESANSAKLPVSQNSGGSIVEAFKEIRELSSAWDDVKCVCSALGRSRCELNCKEYEDE